MDTVDDMELHKAAFEGDLAQVRTILDGGKCDINGYDKHGNTPLILALHFKREEIVQELLARGADSGRKTKAGWSPIRYALASAFLPNIRTIHRANMIRERVNMLQRLPTMIASLKSVR
jgi:ankyrin repeat protein